MPERIRDQVARMTPTPVKRLVPSSVKDRILGTQSGYPPLPSYGYFSALMDRYRTKDLVNVEPDAFRKRIADFLTLTDPDMEGFADPSVQRDLSIKFHWGHDHDFGDFKVDGKLGDRHVSLIAALSDDWLRVLPRSLEGLRVLDIGCWTGGTSLLLAAMGAHVVAVEEVRKYTEALDYLRHAFALEHLEPRNLSLFECTEPQFQDAFDIVLFAGVLYHVTDPVLALRITFNCLKNGGRCVVETAVTYSDEPIVAYEGPTVVLDGSEEDLSRSGWNWFLPSPVTLKQMMTDVGYEDISTTKVLEGSGGRRVLATGTRHRHRDMLRGGLSVRTIR